VSDVYSESRHKSQKVRRCEGCWYKTETNPIQIGDLYWSCFCVNEGDAGFYSLCTACHDFLETDAGKAFLKESVDGWEAGEVAEARKWVVA